MVALAPTRLGTEKCEDSLRRWCRKLSHLPKTHLGKRTMARLLRRLGHRAFRKEEGATLAEYGLLLALIAVVCIAAVTLLGTSLSSMFTSIAGSV
jgi:pilus assembly protein Flp/PilA